MFDRVAEGRERNGKPREERPVEVDEFLEPSEEVGYNEGLPLLDRSYDQYPSRQELLQPDGGEVLESLADHDLVSSISDIASELNTREEVIEKATELHGIEIESTFDITVASEEDTISVPIEGQVEIDHLREPLYDDSRLLYHLYVQCGMGIEEIAESLSAQLERNREVRARDIRQGLVNVGLIDGDRTNYGNGTIRDNDIRLGGAAVDISEDGPNRKFREESRGLTVNANDYA